MSDGFVVSTVVISKETPLSDPVKTFRAAIQAAMDPARGHEALADAAASLDPDTPRYAELSRWVTSPASGLDERFAATLLCHERLRGGDVPGSDETVDALVRFWGGEPLRVAELRRALRSVGAAGSILSLRSQSATWRASGSGSPPGCCGRRGTPAGSSCSTKSS